MQCEGISAFFVHVCGFIMSRMLCLLFPFILLVSNLWPLSIHCLLINVLQILLCRRGSALLILMGWYLPYHPLIAIAAVLLLLYVDVSLIIQGSLSSKPIYFSMFLLIMTVPSSFNPLNTCYRHYKTMQFQKLYKLLISF